jgi:RNA polymerase primary sigma factor
MRRIQNPDLAQLLMQVRFAPPKQRKKQIDSAEELLDTIEKDKEYPYEFVCFKITGYRPTAQASTKLIKGSELAEDLRIFIWKLSGQVAPPASAQNEKLYMKKDLALKLNVSTKTIDRWRKRGLKFRKYVFDDRIKRLGFLESTVDKFIKEHPAIIEKAKRFTRLTAKQKNQIIEQAAELSRQTILSRHQIIKKIAAQTITGHETIRNLLLNYQKINSQKGVDIRKPSKHLDTSEAFELDGLHKQGRSLKELMNRFNLSRSSIFRILKQRRIQSLLSRRIDFIQSNDFLKSDAEEKIIGLTPILKRPVPKIPALYPVLKNGSLSSYLESLKNTRVLNRQEEIDLFKRYNFLKYHSHAERERLRTGKITSSLLRHIEKSLSQAEAIKRIIIEANLRLVVSIANRHTITGANVADLVSEGNMALMQAVEKFDYTKGFRFSTYASWVISKDFARRIPGRSASAARVAAAANAASEAKGEFQSESLRQTDVAELERARHDLIKIIKNNLEQREQYIIINHFGLEGTLIRKNTKTLKQIGDDLGLSKERVRQIELICLQKLRQSLSPEQFDLLMG